MVLVLIVKRVRESQLLYCLVAKVSVEEPTMIFSSDAT